MGDAICVYCDEEPASVYHGDHFVCEYCKRETEQSESELAYVNKRNKEVSEWVKSQGEISLEEIMLKAYNEFIRFDDFGRVLHFYIKQKETKLYKE